MNKQLFGFFLIFFGLFKIITSVLNELFPDYFKERVLYQKKDSTTARQVFNFCFFLYGIDSFMHGLYLNRIWITTQPWILSHTGSYAVHAILGVFMFVLFYGLFDVNESFYVVEGIYTGLLMMMLIPIMYIYNTWGTISKASPIMIASILSIGVFVLVGRSIMLKNPDRVPNIVEMVAITINSLI